MAAALYDATCFFKNQKKRDPMECDKKLYALWCDRKDTYPGQTFNKFHAAFCAVRNYVHKYHMAGRVKEENTEAFNSVLEK